MRKKEVKKNDLRITNMVCSGKLPFTNIIFHDVITKGKLKWELIDGMTSSILQTRFYRDKGINVHRKKKCICISIWWTGSINIVGVLSFAEGQKYYDLIVEEIKELRKK